MKIPLHCSVQDITDVDLIIVGSFCDVYSAINTNRDAIAWLKRRYDKGSTIASVCLGAFLLSETGLLNGKSATTHWGFAKQFCQMYPKVRLKPEKMITDEGELLCSGACTSYMDLSLYLVDRYCGYPVAVECAKSMIHEFDRRSQNAYIGYVFHKEHNDNEIWRVQKWIETNYVATTDFDSLSKKHGMSRRTFERRFREATGTTPTGYLQHTRIEHAKSLLENTHQTFDQITDAVGYKDSSFFRKVFIKHTGLRPKKYQSKFGKK